MNNIIPLNLSFRQSDCKERRGIYSLYFACQWNPNYLLEILTLGPPRAGRASFIPSSTVVFGFAYGSSRKASIKEFHQIVSLTVTTPLRMTGLGLPFLQICHSDRKTVRFRRGIYSFILVSIDFFSQKN